ncbi:MAG: hypothetical protein D6683_15620, partial [Actinomyces sp.]
DDNIVQPALARLEAAIGAASGPPAGPTLADLSCSTGQVPLYDGTAWVCAISRTAHTAVTEDARTLDDGGGPVPVGSEVGRYTAIAIPSGGLPVIAHYDVTGGDLVLWRCSDVHCTSGTSRTLDSVGDVGRYAAIAVGRDGSPLIAYYDTAGRLRLFVCGDAACDTGSARTLDNGGTHRVGQFPSIAIGLDGNPVISYLDFDGGTLRFYACADPACTAARTSRSLPAGPAGNAIGWSTSVAIAGDGNPVIAYEDHTLGEVGLYLCGDPACATGAPSTLGLRGADPSLVIGIDGNPFVAHTSNRAGASSLTVTHCDDPACTGSRSLIGVDGGVGRMTGQYPSTLLGVDGNPVIAYHDATDGDLKLRVCDDPACTSGLSRVVDTGGAAIVGSYTSLARTADGAVLVAYQDATSGALKVARVMVAAAGSTLDVPLR